MADSNVTKNLLANGLKELVKVHPFEKINVVQISEQCGMNRKSFYYHFKDKYDLVNWIFDTEVCSLLAVCSQDQWKFLELLCCYFDENRAFYRSVMHYQGQNSFTEHFREFLYPLLHARLRQMMDTESVDPIGINFFADGIIGGIERWLMGTDDMTPERFVGILKSLIYTIADRFQAGQCVI